MSSLSSRSKLLGTSSGTVTGLVQADVRLAQAESRLAQAKASLVFDILTPNVTAKLVLLLLLDAIAWLVEAVAGLALAINNHIFNLEDVDRLFPLRGLVEVDICFSRSPLILSNANNVTELSSFCK